MMDLINPWGALRRAQHLIAELLADRESMEREIEDYYLAYKDADSRLDAAKELIAQGHFRNPKTGRIGPMGETFDV